MHKVSESAGHAGKANLRLITGRRRLRRDPLIIPFHFFSPSSSPAYFKGEEIYTPLGRPVKEGAVSTKLGRTAALAAETLFAPMDSGSLRVTFSSSRRPDAAANQHIFRLQGPRVTQPWSHRLRRRSQISRSAFCLSGRAAQAGLVRCFAQAEMLEDRGEDMHSAASGSFSASYKLGELLGIGSFGKVYRAVSRAQPGQDFAVKVVSKHREGVLDERIARRIREEVRARLQKPRDT